MFANVYKLKLLKKKKKISYVRLNANLPQHAQRADCLVSVHMAKVSADEDLRPRLDFLALVMSVHFEVPALGNIRRLFLLLIGIHGLWPQILSEILLRQWNGKEFDCSVCKVTLKYKLSEHTYMYCKYVSVYMRAHVHTYVNAC